MEHEIEQATAAFADAVARGDAAAVAAVYTDDGRLLAPTAELIAGRRHIEAYWRAGLALGLRRVELRALDLQIDDDVAVEIGRYTLALDGGDDDGTYVVLHRRQADGAWRRTVDVFNPDKEEQ
jgi:uncharacterized protein (TIGR02246 family)